MCNIVCRTTLDAKTAKEFKEKIEDEYRVNMYVNPLCTYIFLHLLILIILCNSVLQDPR